MFGREAVRRAPKANRGLAVALAASLAASGGLVASVLETAPAHAAPALEVSGWGFYGAAGAVASLNAHIGAMSESTPFFFTAKSATDIGYTTNITKTRGDTLLASYRSAAQSAGKPLIATVVDGLGPRVMAGILADPASRAAHVQALVAFVNDNAFDGIDLDYESFAFNDGSASWGPAPNGLDTFSNWGQFLIDLDTALGASKRLEVSVPPVYNGGRDKDSGYWVYNYPVMNQVVDRIKVMLYSYTVSTPGPNAPYGWVSSSVDAIIKFFPGIAPKLVMGIPAYGTDWVTKIEGSCPSGVAPAKRSLQTANAAQYAFDRGVDLNASWVETGTVGGKTNQLIRERSFSYVDTFTGPDVNGITVRCNVTRTVWYDDANAIYQRALLAQTKGIAGVALWALGYEDAVTWDGIAAAAAGTTGWAAPAAAVPPPRDPPAAPIVSSGPLPARYLDTRKGFKTTDNQFAGIGRQPADSVLELPIAGRGPVPGGTSAVALNVTVIGGGTGFVTVYPCGATRPTTSNLNVASGQIISNSVITKLSAAGAICIYTQQPADLIVDVFDVLPDTAVKPLATPGRVLDTRPGEPTVDGQSSGGGPLVLNGMVEVQVAGRGGLAATAKSAILNVTAAGAVANGFLTVWPCDTPRPTTSNVNYTKSAPIPNAVVTALSARGTVCIFSSNATDVIVDVFGALDPSSYSPLAAPARLMETRTGLSTIDSQANAMGKRALSQETVLMIAGRGGMSATPGAAILNVTVDAPELAGYVTVYPCGTARPPVSNVNFAPGQTLPNLVVTQIATDGTVCIFTSSPTHVIVDVFGALNI